MIVRGYRRWPILMMALILLLLLPFGCGELDPIDGGGGEAAKQSLKYAFCAIPELCTSSAHWTTVTVDEGAGIGQHTSLALDNTDSPVIIYYDSVKTDLKHATCTGDCGTEDPDWSIQELQFLSAIGDFGRHSSLKLELEDNYPHISYYNATGKDLWYACVNDTDGQLFFLVDSEGDVGQYSSLALTDGDLPRIAYYDRTNGAVKYAFNNEGCEESATWTETTFKTVGDIPTDVDRAISLALDSNGDPRIAYYDVDGGKNLEYAICKTGCETDGADWADSTADESNDVGQYPSLSLNSLDEPTISYYDAEHKDLKVVICKTNCTKIDLEWSEPTKVAGKNGKAGLYSSLDLDQVGDFHLAYYDETDDTLKYAFCSPVTISTCTDSEKWTRKTAVDGLKTGRFASLGVDSTNGPHISYFAKK